MAILRRKQSKFVKMVSLLINYADLNGYQLTLGDGYRDPRCMYGAKTSLHRKRLAIDFNLFRDGLYLTDTDDYEFLGIFWEFIGGTWGGRFGDGNHFSLEHKGHK
jgi:hypothetical protein